MDERKRHEAWEKLHRLECQIDYLQRERDSLPEQVNAKHAWDMILCHILRELSDVKELIKEEVSHES